MDKIKSNVNYLVVSIQNSFKTLTIYRTSTILNTVTIIFTLTIQYFLWKSVYAYNEMDIYSFDEMIIYIIVVVSISPLYNTGVSANIAKSIRDGSVTHYLLKPKSFESLHLGSAIGAFLYKMITFTIPALLVLFLFYGSKVDFGFVNLVSFFIVIVLSFLFLTFFDMLIGMIAFYTRSIWGINNFRYILVDFFSGKLLPLFFYPVALLNIIEILPFKNLYYTPINILLNKSSLSLSYNFISGVIYIFISFLAFKIVFIFLINKVEIQGG